MSQRDTLLSAAEQLGTASKVLLTAESPEVVQDCINLAEEAIQKLRSLKA